MLRTNHLTNMSITAQLQEFMHLNPWCSYLTVVVLGGALFMAGKAAIRHEFVKAIILLLAVAAFVFAVNYITVHTLALWVDQDSKGDGINAIIYWVALCALESGLVRLYYTKRKGAPADDEAQDEDADKV